MESYTISLASSAERDLRRINHQFVPRVTAAIDALAEEPRPNGSRKLAGSLHTYRIRVGEHRIIYSVEDRPHEVVVHRIRHRKDAYR